MSAEDSPSRIVRLPDGRRIGAHGDCIVCPSVGSACDQGREIAFIYWDPANSEMPGLNLANAEIVTICASGSWWLWLGNHDLV